MIKLYALLDKKGYDDGRTDSTRDDHNVSAKPVVESTAEFRDGVCCGYLTYYDEHEGKPLTGNDVYHFLMRNIIDVRGTDQFNAGYCTGWIEA